MHREPLDKNADAPTAVRLIDLPLDEARAIKWKRGRVKYGGPVFVGDPLEQLFDELVEKLNYCEEAKRQGINVEWIPGYLTAIAAKVQALHVIHVQMEAASCQL